MLESEKSMEHEGDSDINCNWWTSNDPQRMAKGTGRLGNKRASGDHLDHGIIKINQNSETSPGDMRRLAVTQTPVRNYQLSLVGKTLEKNTHKLLWDFNIHTDHQISARGPDLIIINKKKKKNLQNCRLCCPGWPQNKTERMWKEG